MKKIKLIAFVSIVFGLLVSFNVTASASSLNIKVNDIYTNSKTITGTATKGVNVIVRNSNNKTIAKSKASKTTGKFSVKLHTKLVANQKLYVYANQAKGKYFYRIQTVMARSNKSSNSSKNVANNSAVTLQTPTGIWKSGSNHGYYVVYKFNQTTGFNQYIYKGSKLVKKTISYAAYDVTPSSNAFWKITYHERGKSSKSFYLRFNSNKQFAVVDKNNHAIKVKYANLPLSYYKANLIK
ncbi:Ig-like domain-containing protein [Lentilactobacillus laojiaonis]|uniref:Ig-like domain-containing protein n=1 Tax=Lentilactobacillus laojiaonis TaxID=2883998 RepID=UPI001D0B7D32|nr:Ig-like domain-containing protein [Lentilactobacillus laojiaonis]UDM32210.1 Ig-like domain-containing protein [Lentilactobacillus laojiaonis]